MSDMTAGAPGYTPIARVLHWTVAALVSVDDPAWHRDRQRVGRAGAAIPLQLAQVDWRDADPARHHSAALSATHPAPPLPNDIPAIQQFAAHATHWALYVLILLQPIVGYIMTSAYPAPVPFFGLFNLPAIWPENRALSEQLSVVHLYIGLAIAAVAAMHIGAALFHHFVRKDRVLMRMISG